MRSTRLLVGAGLVALTAVLAGCSTAPIRNDSAVASQPAATGSGSEPAAPDVAPGLPAPDAPPGGPGRVLDAAGTAARSGQPVPASRRQVVRDASIELRVGDVAEAAERARSVAPDHGGFVAAEESVGSTVSLTLRVAGAELDAALAALADLGEVTSRRLGTQDVTEETVDLAARIASQRASVERVRALLDRAVTIGEVVQVEAELTWRQAELESLEQRAAALADQVALSTVRVRLVGAEPPPVAAGGFGSGLAAGWDALRATGGVALRVLGAVVPFVAVLALPVGLGVLWYRRRRRPVAVGDGQ